MICFQVVVYSFSRGKELTSVKQWIQVFQSDAESAETNIFMSASSVEQIIINGNPAAYSKFTLQSGSELSGGHNIPMGLVEHVIVMWEQKGLLVWLRSQGVSDDEIIKVASLFR